MNMKNRLNLKLIIYSFCLAVLLFAQSGHAQENDLSFSRAGLSPNETIRLIYDEKPFQYITGSASQISGNDVSNVSGVNRLNSLSGRLSGLVLYDIDGLPGYENSAFKIRGDHTFSSNRSPVVLIDGRVDDITMLDPYDIESVTILKDAAASVLYGLRSTNGIILITTKRGREGKIAINLNTETSFSQPTRMPEFLDSYHYASLYNEAMLNDDPNAVVRFDENALDAYKNGSDRYRYPNVNWADEFLKDFSVQTRNNINVSGGGKTAKFYVSINYLHEDGLFNVDKSINTYNTNSSIDVMNIHGNVELNLSKNLTLSTDIRAKKDKRNAPGTFSENYDESIFSTLFSTPFNAHPILNEDGSIAGTSDYRNNPYGLLNYKGYNIWERSSLSSFIELTYDLSSLIEGLKFGGRIGFNNYNDYYINRTKNFAVYQLNPDGTSYNKIGLDSEIGNTGAYSSIFRNYDHSLFLKYSGQFAKHQLDLMLMYDRQQIDNARSNNLTQNFQGPKGVLSYRFNNKYLIDFAFSYQGSEQYPDDNRYGFFPAVSAGWIISKENFLGGADFVDLIKLRGSYGQTGNQVSTYFGYLGSFSSGSGYIFGTSPASASGFYENRIANPLLTWEKCLKKNIGFDLAFFKNQLNASFDYFTEENKDILIQNAITDMYGATVYVPKGIFENKGYEFQIGWNQKINDFSYFINVNYSFSGNEIVFQDEELRNHSWMYRTGNPLNTRFGYVFDRFYTEDDNIDDLPDQSLLGTQRPGDLKYKDLNDDGVIDDNDITSIGKSKMPETNYGINFGAKYKGLDISVLLHGSGNSTTYNSGTNYWDFYNKTGNVLKHHLNRWTPGAGQSAGYPRLSLSNTNNYATSSYWVEDNSFLRLQYIELGYTLPTPIARMIGMTKARIFVNGNNLYCWDKIDFKDPEIQDNGLAYPIQRTISAGLNLSF
jgi:TonB-linked SusC/RagA family outer membrane protein